MYFRRDGTYKAGQLYRSWSLSLDYLVPTIGVNVCITGILPCKHKLSDLPRLRAEP